FMNNDSLDDSLNGKKQNRVIVFVDDDKVQHMINKRILLKVDPTLTLIFFENPNMALEWLSSNKGNILLLDINMPEMKGWELLGELERRGINSDAEMRASSIAAEDIEESTSHERVRGFLNKRLREEEVEIFLNAD